MNFSFPKGVCVPLWETTLSTAARFSCVCNVCPALLFLLSMPLVLPFMMPYVWRYCLLLHYPSLISYSPIAQQMCRSVNSHLYHNSCIRNPIITIMGVWTLYNHTYLQYYVWFPHYTSLRLSTYVKSGIVPLIGHVCLLPNPFQFFSFQSPCNFTAYNPTVFRYCRRL